MSNSSEILWIAASAVATFLLAIVAIATLWFQNRQFKISREEEKERNFKNSSVQLILNFDAQFVDLQDFRFEAANHIINTKILNGSVIHKYDSFNGNLEEIYDFFDTLGFFIKQDYIKAEVVHNYFYYWFSHYYEFYKQYNVKHLSGYEETAWNNLDFLLKALNDIEEKQLGRKIKTINKNMLIDFFIKEKNYLGE